MRSIEGLGVAFTSLLRDSSPTRARRQSREQCARRTERNSRYRPWPLGAPASLPAPCNIVRFEVNAKVFRESRPTGMSALPGADNVSCAPAGRAYPGGTTIWTAPAEPAPYTDSHCLEYYLDQRGQFPLTLPSPQGEGTPGCSARKVRALQVGRPSDEGAPSPWGEGRVRGNGLGNPQDLYQRYRSV